MKKLMVLICLITAFTSCKNDDKKEKDRVTDELDVAIDDSVVTGSFMYFADAAVFQTKSELFGVVENDKLQDLILQSEPLKNEATDEVAVTLKVKKSRKPENEEGWDYRIEILEIIEVSKASSDQNKIIKLGTEKNAENQ